MAKKAAPISGGKRGSMMKGMNGGKSTFTPYTGNVVQSSSKSGLKGGAKTAKPGKAT